MEGPEQTAVLKLGTETYGVSAAAVIITIRGE